MYQRPSEFVLMTAQGTSIYHGLSGAQQLLQILRMSNGMETPELERFMFSRDKDAEGTSCCIQIACDPSIDQQTARWATFAFFRFVFIVMIYTFDSYQSLIHFLLFE